MSDARRRKSAFIAHQEKDAPLVHLEKQQTDEIAATMRAKHIVTAERVAVSMGIKEDHYILAYNRGKYANGDERDEYLYRQVEQARAEAETYLQEQWIAGAPGAQSYLLALSKRYNAKYREELNEELAHMMGIVSRHVTQEQMLQIVDDIIEFEPSLDFDGEGQIEVALPEKSRGGHE